MEIKDATRARPKDSPDPSREASKLQQAVAAWKGEAEAINYAERPWLTKIGPSN